MSGFNKSGAEDLDISGDKQFLCQLCDNALKDPVVSTCCGLTYCKICINNWIKTHNKCPNDEKELNESQLTKLPNVLINLLNSMSFRCDYSKDGCHLKIKFTEMSKHLSFCAFNPNRLCADCELTLDSEHNCIKGLKIKNIGLNEENEKLKQKINEMTENIELKTESITKLKDKINHLNLKNSQTIDELNRNKEEFKTRINENNIIATKVLTEEFNHEMKALIPRYNVASIQSGAKVIQGFGDGVISGEFANKSNYTYHNMDREIVIQLYQPFLLDSMRLRVKRENTYCVWVSNNQIDWQRVGDIRYGDVWQVLLFNQRIIQFIRIKGNCGYNDIFKVRYIECPALHFDR